MVVATLKKATAGRKPVIALFILLLTSLYLMSNATQNSLLFGELYSTLLIVNFLALLVLLLLIGRHLVSLILQYRRRESGSRLTVRLVVMFSILAVAPISVLYYFSVQFVHRGIDSWFDIQIGPALEDALELGRASLDGKVKESLRETHLLSGELLNISNSAAPPLIYELRQSAKASEFTLLTDKGRVIASSSSDPTQIVPTLPGNDILQQLRQGLDYAAIEPVHNRGLQIHIVVTIPATSTVSSPRILQALYPIPEHQGALAENVQNAYTRYRELAFLRRPLKQSFTLTLSLVLLLSLLTAVWAAFFSARRLVAPLRDLAEGTQSLAAGDYGTRLPIPSRDEIGFLVRSFNEMAFRIDHARLDAARSQEEVESQRAYLEAVLRRLSSGVLTLDTSGEILTANQAAAHILHLPVEQLVSYSLERLVTELPALEPLLSAIQPHINSSAAEWRAEVILFSAAGRQVLICRGSPLAAPGDGETEGHVIVFDDITTLIQAQRDAAWGEVARRLAHEIKNPLTPIQLSAERLRHKYLHAMTPEDGDVLDRATHTIVQQVETMKTMVKAFSDYARPPKLNLESLNLRDLVEEVVELYWGSPNTNFTLSLSADTPAIEADRGRLRQLLHNLIKNGQEAVGTDQVITIAISLHCSQQDNCHSVELTLCDDGPGIPDELLGQIFEPYVTTKPKGSGLGLAIVKKIVEEHGGLLSMENRAEGGAMVTVRLPILPRTITADEAGAAIHV